MSLNSLHLLACFPGLGKVKSVSDTEKALKVRMWQFLSCTSHILSHVTYIYIHIYRFL